MRIPKNKWELLLFLVAVLIVATYTLVIENGQATPEWLTLNITHILTWLLGLAQEGKPIGGGDNGST